MPRGAYRCRFGEMRTLCLSLVLVASLVALAALLVAVPSCGPSPQRKALTGYRAQSAALLDREAKVWQRVVDLNLARHEEQEPYYHHLTTVAIPYYEELLGKVEALTPKEPPELVAAHERFLEFARQRVQFFQSEQLGREVVEKAVRSQVLKDLDAADVLAREAEKTLREWEDSDPTHNLDPRFTRLKEVTETFERDHFGPLVRGEVPVAEVQERIRRHVLPGIDALKDERWRDNDREQLALKVVVAARNYFVLLADTLPDLVLLNRVNERSKTAEERASQSLRDFHKGMQELR